MANVALIELIPCVFDDRARDDLCRIESDTAADLKAYETGCAENHMRCLAVHVDGIRRGTLITSFLQEDCLVFVCNAGRIERIEAETMTGVIIDLCEQLAISRGAKKVRFWTARKGLEKTAKVEGYRTLYVMEKDLE